MCGETQYAGKKHMYQWGLERRSDNIDVLRSAPERSGVGQERSGGVGNTGWWKHHMYQWGLERRSDNIDVLRSAPERSGVAPEWGRSAPELRSSGAPEWRRSAPKWLRRVWCR